MVTKKELESIEGRCPYCDSKLGEDYSANITCWACRDKWDIKTEDSFHEVFGKYIETWYIDTRKLQSHEIDKLHPPRCCPSCGSFDIKFVIGKNTHGSAIYDVYCEDCTWSGDISPDSDLRVYRGSKER